MFNFLNKKKSQESNVSEPSNQNGLKQINEDLYKHNLEIAFQNKTLSLLSKLYEVSVLQYMPDEMSEKLSEAVLKELGFEISGIFSYDNKGTQFLPLGFAYSDRCELTRQAHGLSFIDSISQVNGNSFLEALVDNKTMQYGFGLEIFWIRNFPIETIKKINEDAHIRTAIAFPLLSGDKIIGMLLLGINRIYDTLLPYEKDSLASIAKVISLGLDRSMLYSEIKMANEKLESQDKLKTEFLSLASHQLRSPLTAIKGYSSMILEGSYGPISNDAQKEAVSRVFQSSLNLAKVVDDLLNISKIEQGGMKYEFAMVDVEKLAKELSNEFALAVASKKLTLDFSIDGNEPYLVKADLIKLRQVFLNFIDNSIKYTKEGFVHVKVSKNKEKNLVTFSVTDSGMGMTEETKAKLFQKFSRGEGGSVNAGGSGLGLYLAKEIIDAHGGRVWVESPGIGLGSTFYVEMKAL